MKRKGPQTLPFKVSVVAAPKKTPQETRKLKTLSQNPSNETPAHVKKPIVFERRKMLTEQKAAAPQKKTIPVRNSSGFQKNMKKMPFSQTLNSDFKGGITSKKTPSVFKRNKSIGDEIIEKKKPKRTILGKTNEKRQSPAKSPNSSNKNESSIEEVVKKKTENTGKKGEMKELIGVLINLTKTLKEKSQNIEENSEKTLESPFEMNIKTVFPNDFERDKVLNTPKLEGLEEMEKIVTEKNLTEKVNQELMRDDEDDEDLLSMIGKNINVEKFNGLLNKSNALSEQIQRALNGTDNFD